MQNANPNAPETFSATPGPLVVADFVQKLRSIRDALDHGLVERDVAVRLALLAALAGEHLLLLGPPGTAKSLIARQLHLAFGDSPYFERLLTRFTVPEEIFGPLSIKGLEEDRYQRLTDSYLPKASIAFLDEIFKANSAILNALLTLLNEREFDNGTVREITPLVAVIGASNELPEGEELDALFDRFLLRLHVGPVSKAAFPTLLGLRGQTKPVVPEPLGAHELLAVQQVAEVVELPDDVVALLCELREWCTAEKVFVSDRRWRKIVKLLQVSAATNGRTQVSIWDCWLLQHCLWNTPESRQKVYEWYAARVGASAAMDPSRLTRIVVAWEGKLQSDKDDRSQLRTKEGRLVFKGPDGKYTFDNRGSAQAKRGSSPLFLAPTGAYSMQGHYHSEQIHDRSKGGSGYTRDELDALHVPDNQWVGLREFRHWSGKDKYLASPSNWLMEEVGLPAVLEPTRHKEIYVQGCIREMDQLRDEITKYRERLAEHMASLDSQIREHLWVTPDFAGPAAKNLEQTRREVDALLSRVDRLREGFESLPREGQPGPEPIVEEPVVEPPVAMPKRGRK